MNASGQTAFVIGLEGTNGGLSDNQAILRFDVSPRQAVSVGQKGDPMPTSSGVYVPVEKAPAINDAGQVAFLADVDGTPNNSAEVILRGDGVNLVEMIRSETLLPSGGSVRGFAPGAAIGFNNSGHVAALVENASGSGGDTIVMATSPGSLSEVARVGQPVPNQSFTFKAFDPHVMLNDQGDCVFLADLTAVDSVSIGRALFRGTEVVLLEDSLVPNGAGTFHDLNFSEFALNKRGDIAVLVAVDLTAGGVVDGLFIHLADGGMEEIIRVGDSLADRTVTAIELAGSSANNGSVPLSRNGINDLGQVAFKFTLDGDIDGVAIWSPESIVRPPFASPNIQRVDDGQYQLQFPGLPGVSYQVQRRTSLVSGSWINIGGPAFTSPQGILSVPYSSALDREFFRCVDAD